MALLLSTIDLSAKVEGIDCQAMADSSTELVGGRDLPMAAGKEELSSVAEDTSKDLTAPAPVTTATDERSHKLGCVGSVGPTFTAGPLPAKALLEEAEGADKPIETILRPELSSENGAITAAAAEEDSPSALQSQIQTEGVTSGGLDQGTGPENVI